MNNNLYFVFDTETGGIKKETSLLSLYGIAVDSNYKKIKDIELYIKPNNGIYNVEIEALELNKINLIEHNKKAISADEASFMFKDWICSLSLSGTKIIPVGLKVKFDIKFAKQHLMPEWRKYFSVRTLDIDNILIFLQQSNVLPFNIPGIGERGKTLSSLANYFNIPIDAERSHTAKYDTELTLEILKKMDELVNPTKRRKT